MTKFEPANITADMAARGYNNKGLGELIGFPSHPEAHEEKCPRYKDGVTTCACRAGLWKTERAVHFAVPKVPARPEPKKKAPRKAAR